jgi:hypothetical protein
VSEDLGPLTDRLGRERPRPRATFRGALGRHLRGADPGHGPRPENLHVRVAGWLAAGLIVLVLALLLAL